MTTQDRIKYLRKQLLNITQEEFAKKINMSRSNFANIEKGSVNLTERVIADICRTFSVNREWLMDAEEPIFENKDNTTLNEIVSIYEKLNDDNRKYLKGYVHRLLEEQEEYRKNNN